MTQTLERTTQVVGGRPPEDPMPPQVPWAWLVPVAAAAVLGAAALVLSLGDDAPASDRVLVTSDSGTVSLIDTVGDSGVVYSIENAYAAPDSETIYRIKVEGTDTQIDEIDAVDGSLVGSQTVPGVLEIVAVSPDGDAVALMPDYGGAPGLYAPAPREETSITVARNDGSAARTYDLEGNFEPETFSLDEDTLFLVEFWPPLNPDRY